MSQDQKAPLADAAPIDHDDIHPPETDDDSAAKEPARFLELLAICASSQQGTAADPSAAASDDLNPKDEEDEIDQDDQDDDDDEPFPKRQRLAVDQPPETPPDSHSTSTAQPHASLVLPEAPHLTDDADSGAVNSNAGGSSSGVLSASSQAASTGSLVLPDSGIVPLQPSLLSLLPQLSPHIHAQVTAQVQAQMAQLYHTQAQLQQPASQAQLQQHQQQAAAAVLATAAAAVAAAIATEQLQLHNQFQNSQSLSIGALANMMFPQLQQSQPTIDPVPPSDQHQHQQQTHEQSQQQISSIFQQSIPSFLSTLGLMGHHATPSADQWSPQQTMAAFMAELPKAAMAACNQSGPLNATQLHSFRNIFGVTGNPLDGSVATASVAQNGVGGSPRSGAGSNGQGGRSKEMTMTYTQMPQVKTKRKRPSPEHVQILNMVFERNFFPTTDVRQELARQLGMCPRAVQVWFQNKRQNWRTKNGYQGSNNFGVGGGPVKRQEVTVDDIITWSKQVLDGESVPNNIGAGNGASVSGNADASGSVGASSPPPPAVSNATDAHIAENRNTLVEGFLSEVMGNMAQAVANASAAQTGADSQSDPFHHLDGVESKES